MKKSKKNFGIIINPFIFAPDKNKKDNENDYNEYILVVASVTTEAVVREQHSCIHTSPKKESCRTCGRALSFFSKPSKPIINNNHKIQK